MRQFVVDQTFKIHFPSRKKHKKVHYIMSLKNQIFEALSLRFTVHANESMILSAKKEFKSAIIGEKHRI